jgi:hypothetical protein
MTAPTWMPSQQAACCALRQGSSLVSSACTGGVGQLPVFDQSCRPSAAKDVCHGQHRKFVLKEVGCTRAAPAILMQLDAWAAVSCDRTLVESALTDCLLSKMS